MLQPALRLLGWALARAPEPALRALAAALGELLWLLQPRRRRLVLRNLERAFPHRPPAWRRRLGRTSMRRLVETGMLSLASPSLGEARLRKIARLAPSVQAWALDRAARPRPVVFGTLHLALWESQTWLQLLSPAPLPEFGIIFRPLDNPAMDDYVRRTRERFGMRLLSRKSGFAQAQRILRENGCIGVLFDQNAGMQGALTLLFGRVCSSTELPGLLTARFGAELRTFYPRRTGFWRVAFESDPVEHDGTVEGATVALNRWLERALSGDEDLCACWLWAHDRWRHQDVPATRLRLQSKRDFLASGLAARGLKELPRDLRIRVRLPNWLGDVAMALPLIRALRRSRPDAAVELLASRRFLPLLEAWGVADRLTPLPARGPAYFLRFRRERASPPDVALLFTNSWRGDLEAWLAGVPQRFGLILPGRSRPLLTHGCKLPPERARAPGHQMEDWLWWLRQYGLQGEPDRSPLGPAPARPAGGGRAPIGLIPGSENDPKKRWPVARWRELVAALPAERFLVFGTARDAPICRAVAEGFEADRIASLAGLTDLPGFAAGLQMCRLVVTNDTGGMHLANAVGLPVVALFGPTNPLRTGPVFQAPVSILQPPGCPPQGGRPLDQLAAETVLSALAEIESAISAGRPIRS